MGHEAHAGTFIQWFCRLPQNYWFVEVDSAFIGKKFGVEHKFHRGDINS
jgi:Casein kinase II regulatory subunit